MVIGSIIYCCFVTFVPDVDFGSGWTVRGVCGDWS